MAKAQAPRTPLAVPFAERAEAKALGAQWDGAARQWVVPAGASLEPFRRWLPLTSLPGEDREWGQGLFVDLVPRSCWFTNVRSQVSASDWARLRALVTGRVSGRCEACGVQVQPGGPPFLEVHERWHFDDQTRTQRLCRLVALCTPCHEVTHMGLAMVRGRHVEAVAHLCRVARLSPTEAGGHVQQAFELWKQRNRFTWTLDLSLLQGVGIHVEPPVEAAQRVEVAAQQLQVARRRR